MQQYVFKQHKKSVFATGAKIVGGFAIGIAIAAFGFAGGVCVDEFIIKINGQSRCESLVKKYMEDDICILPDTVYVNQTYDLKYSTGLELANALKNQNIKCCKIGDIYYTENSQEIIVVTLKKTVDENGISLDKIAIDNQIVYIVPNGYVYENGKICPENNTEVVKVFTDLHDDIDFQKLSLSETIIDVCKLQTESYNNIRYNDFILDVSDEIIADSDYNTDNTYEATLKLVPKKW